MPNAGSMTSPTGPVGFRRVLSLSDLVLYGIVVIQPTAPMSVYGVVADEGRGHVVTAVLLSMVAMSLTGVSYGRMARIYPRAGSAYSYATAEFGDGAGYVVGWMILLDYLLNPLICVVWCSSAVANLVSGISVQAWSVFFAILFTMLNLRGVETSARMNRWLAALMGVVVAWMLWCMGQYLIHTRPHEVGFLIRPFYDSATFSWQRVWTATSLAALTYIGFDSISTLSEEARAPERDILRATVLACLLTGLISAIEVYLAQLVWPRSQPFPDINTAYVHAAGRAGGPILFQLVGVTLLVANMGSGIGTQLAAARLLYGMGRDNSIPRRFFGRIESKRGIPSNNIVFVGAVALCGSLLMSYQLGAELLNFGAFIAFMTVNAATFTHYFVRGKNRGWSYWLLPAVGFLMCLWCWANLRWVAMVTGLIWLALGILCSRIRRNTAESMPIEDATE